MCNVYITRDNIIVVPVKPTSCRLVVGDAPSNTQGILLIKNIAKGLGKESVLTVNML